MKRSVIDLFCGIGGLGLGAARAGFQLKLSVDIDPSLLAIHAANFPGSAHLETDVALLTGVDLLGAAGLREGELCGLIGGAPCQGFSRIGKRRTNDARNKLFSHFFRLVAETRPAFFVSENVPGILDGQNRHVVRQGLRRVPGDYLVLEAFTLDAGDFGAPTTRERVFFVGYRRDFIQELSMVDFEQEKWDSSTTVATALTGLPRKLRPTWTSHETGWRRLRIKLEGPFWTNIFSRRPKGVGDPQTAEALAKHDIVSGCIATQHSDVVEDRFAKLAGGTRDVISRMPKLQGHGLCPTLRAGTGPDRGSFQALRPIHFSEPRVITPREAARLQGFPDWFWLGPTKWHAFRGIGNSVSPFVAGALFQVLARKLDRSRGRPPRT